MTTQPNDQGIQWIDAHLHLLDRQVYDVHGVPIAVFGGRPPRSRTHAMPWIAIVDIGVVIKLAITRETTDLTWTERWVRDRIIGCIPGGRHNAGKD